MAEGGPKINGGDILAKALKEQGVEYVFGIVGFPIQQVAMQMQMQDIKFVGMRNEQAASYAASIIGYLTRRPAVVMAVSGPGLVHCLAGMANANENCWPLIVIAGSNTAEQEGRGGFQEFPQVDAARPYAKFSARPSSIDRIPFYVEKAVRMSTYGRPGAVYIDMSADLLNGSVHSDHITKVSVCPEPPRPTAALPDVKRAVQMLFEAKHPLVIIGKGAAYSQAEDSVRQLVIGGKLPFLPTPMGKGVVPDNSDLCVSAARSRALLKADVILLLGARLNWILHFGLPPRYNPKVKVIQVDLCPEELHNNVLASVALQGDVRAVVNQMNEEVARIPGSVEHNLNSDWWKELREKMKLNAAATQALIAEPSPPMNYYHAFHEIESLLPRDCIFVSEGSNTMDISRTMFLQELPRHRLDAGSFGTMGLGAGFALASALWCHDHHPNKRVVCLQGDSAFGFGGMELETICRYKLPVLFIIINNAGIASGLEEEDFKELQKTDPAISLPPFTLTPKARYDKMMAAFGGHGYMVDTKEALREAVTECLQRKRNEPCLINVIISPDSARKSQDFNWLAVSKV